MKPAQRPKPLKNGIDVLCIGSHPDDIEMSMGGTVLSLIDHGYSVAILDLTDGEPTPFGTREKRLAERARASALLGIKHRYLLDLPNRILEYSLENRVAVAEYYRLLKPKVVFAHPPWDEHPDHLAASRICWDARFHAKLTKTGMAGQPWFVPQYIYHEASHLKRREAPSFAVNVTPYFSRKLEAVWCYKSQFHTPERRGFVNEFLAARAKSIGMMIGRRFGESFYAPEVVGMDNPGILADFASGEEHALTADMRKWTARHHKKPATRKNTRR